MEPTESNTPHDGTTRPGPPRRRLNPTIVSAGAFGLTLAGLGVASARSDSSSDTTATTEAAQAGSSTSSDGRPAGRPAETELTGETADMVRTAALAAVPGGTVLRVETDSDGSPYEAHVRRADSTGVVVKVNEAFAVTGIEEGHGGRRGPGGGPRPRPGQTAPEQESD